MTEPNDEELSAALAGLAPVAGPPVLFAGNSAPSDKRAALTDFDNQLILDLVARLRTPETILSHWGLTKDDLVARANNPEWAARYREQSAFWNSDVNLRERIRAKAAYLLEDSLVPLFKIVTSDKSTAAKLEAIEKLIKISTVAHVPKDAEPPGEPRRISIHFGGTTNPQKVVVVSEDKNERTAIGIIPAA
ncbi:MAG TPA: hypothetical protein VIJ38_13610 [Acidobacteriaceae bacterium]